MWLFLFSVFTTQEEATPEIAASRDGAGQACVIGPWSYQLLFGFVLGQCAVELLQRIRQTCGVHVFSFWGCASLCILFIVRLCICIYIYIIYNSAGNAKLAALPQTNPQYVEDNLPLACDGS